MTATTVDRLTTSRKIEDAYEDEAIIASGSTILVGAMCLFDTAGKLVNATDAASVRMAGIVYEILNDSGAIISAGTGNAGGTVKAKFRWGHEELLNVDASIQSLANLNKIVTVFDNVTVGGSATTNDVAVGTLAQFISITDLTQAWIKIRSLSTTDVAA